MLLLLFQKLVKSLLLTFSEWQLPALLIHFGQA